MVTAAGVTIPGPWQDMGLYWMHYHFGNKARNCKQPCAWMGN
jgi:hypothetical protein